MKTRLVLILSLLMGQPVWAKPSKVPFNVGEQLIFDVGWKSATAGTVELKITGESLRQSRPAYRIVLDASTNSAIDMVFRVRDRYESWFDIGKLCTAGFARRIQEGDYVKQEDVFVNVLSGDFKARHIKPNKSAQSTTETGRYPLNTQDYLSVCYYLRTLPLEPGKSYPAKVASGDSTVDVMMKITRREKIIVPAGAFNCVVGEPMVQGVPADKASMNGKIFVWFTDDAKHVPVKIVADLPFGKIEATLHSLLN